MAGRKKKEEIKEDIQQVVTPEVMDVITKQNEVIATLVKSKDSLTEELQNVNKNLASLTDQLVSLSDKISTGGFSLFGRK